MIWLRISLRNTKILTVGYEKRTVKEFRKQSVTKENQFYQK